LYEAECAGSLASIHETDWHGSLALLIQQPDDFRSQLQEPGEVCFNGGLFAQLAPVGLVFAKPVLAKSVLAKHDICLPYKRLRVLLPVGEMAP